MTPAYLIFHINMAFSSISEDSRNEVIRKCYHPLLDLAESTGIPIGIELTGWSLKQITEHDSQWTERFRHMLDNGRIELIGSGWSQLIGPLVPYEVNKHNQLLGLEAYRDVLSIEPRIALVNEMALSTSMVDLYADMGYKSIITDRDNVRLALQLDHTPPSTTPTHAQGKYHELPVLWSDSMLFQRFQRVVHGDIPVSEYLSYVRKRLADGKPLPIYSSDAETFDYRPGRYKSESVIHSEGEWDRMEKVCRRLHREYSLHWVSPWEALKIQISKLEKDSRQLTSISQPILVKKKSKYNISRWAVTGRNDLWINTACHRIYNKLIRDGIENSEVWSDLCELWASDYRTHITERRWGKVRNRISKFNKLYDIKSNYKSTVDDNDYENINISSFNITDKIDVSFDQEQIYMDVKTPKVQLTLNLRRGLTLYTLSFVSHDFRPIIGTLPQGYFDTIELGSDYYSGGSVVELPVERTRLTDLEWITPTYRIDENKLIIKAEVTLAQGTINKYVILHPDQEYISLGYSFPNWEKPLGVIRTGTITLIPDFFSDSLEINCANGGAEDEKFQIDRPFDHMRPGSTLVSCSSGFGATKGRINLGSSQNGIIAEWDPSKCAVMPLMQHITSGGTRDGKSKSLTRVTFSLSELDESSFGGGQLPYFELKISPY